MALTPTAIQPGTTLVSDATNIVTAPAGTTVLTASTFSNPTTAAVALEITLTRNGGSKITIVPSRSIGGGATVQPAELAGLVLNQGDVVAASGAQLTAVINGYVVS